MYATLHLVFGKTSHHREIREEEEAAAVFAFINVCESARLKKSLQRGTGTHSDTKLERQKEMSTFSPFFLWIMSFSYLRERDFHGEQNLPGIFKSKHCETLTEQLNQK